MSPSRRPRQLGLGNPRGSFPWETARRFTQLTETRRARSARSRWACSRAARLACPPTPTAVVWGRSRAPCPVEPRRSLRPRRGRAHRGQAPVREDESARHESPSCRACRMRAVGEQVLEVLWAARSATTSKPDGGLPRRRIPFASCHDSRGRRGFRNPSGERRPRGVSPCMGSSSRVVVLGSAALVGLVVSLTGCSGGSAPGPTTEGSGTSSPSEGSPGSSSGSASTRDAEGTHDTSNGPASDAPASSPPDEDEETPPSTPPGSAGPRPECVAFANHQCACNGSHATANCTTSLAAGCEAGVKNCSSQLAWYNCVTANACGTNACVGLGKGPC